LLRLDHGLVQAPEHEDPHFQRVSCGESLSLGSQQALWIIKNIVEKFTLVV
jgi:hypothetical protein